MSDAFAEEIESQTGIVGRENGVTPAPDVYQLEAEAVRATLKLWFSLPPASANRVQAMCANHFAEYMERLKAQAKP